MKERCKICESEKVKTFLILNDVPVANNVICRSYDAARHFPLGNLHFKMCKSCNFVWNAAYKSELLSYDCSYENNQYFSETFQEHVDSVIDEFAICNEPLYIVEIGCGQGYFLQRLRQRLSHNICETLGFDPALREENQSVHLKRGVLDSALFPENFLPNVLVSRYVIEHILDIADFFRNISKNVKSAKYCFIETPSIEWIVNNRAYYDMYYEHCSLFSKKSLKAQLRKNGYHDIHVKQTFANQYLLAIACKSSTATRYKEVEEPLLEIEEFHKGFLEYSNKWAERLNEWRRKYKKIGIWGAASKGVMFLCHMQAQGILLDGAIDINPQKQGGFIPGCGTPILSPTEAKTQGIHAIIVSNPHYFTEISAICKSINYNAVLLPLE